MEKKMKEKFYVFLDIDGTLWDWDTLIKNQKKIIVLNEESVESLKVLLESIKRKYDLDLVITSRRRCCWNDCLCFLEMNGFDVRSYFPNKTQLERIKTPRGVKIAEYLRGDRLILGPFQKFLARRILNAKKNNFVVIDDDLRPLKKYVPKENIICTDSVRRALDHEMVERFLSNRRIEVVKLEKKEIVEKKKEEKKTKAIFKKNVKEVENEHEPGEE